LLSLGQGTKVFNQRIQIHLLENEQMDLGWDQAAWSISFRSFGPALRESHPV
jgi:hypothetical protein